MSTTVVFHLVVSLVANMFQLSDASLPDDTSLPTDLTHWGSQDVAIAAFLMLLWRDMYPPRPLPHIEGSSREWDTWGRPLGGFVDLGCVSKISISASCHSVFMLLKGEWSVIAYPHGGGVSRIWVRTSSETDMAIIPTYYS